jgi:hypothetical protein
MTHSSPLGPLTLELAKTPLLIDTELERPEHVVIRILELLHRSLICIEFAFSTGRFHFLPGFSQSLGRFLTLLQGKRGHPFFGLNSAV